MHSGHFQDRLAVFMGWPSPAIVPHAGTMMRSGSAQVPLDAHGFALELVRAGGQHWRVQHDAIEQTVFEDTRRAGVEGERGPRSIFNSAIPLEHLNADLVTDERTGRPRRAQRLAIIPDARYYRRTRRRRARGAGAFDGAVRAALVDHKTLHYSPNTYSDSALRATSRAGRRSGRRAVTVRADAVSTDYVRHAQQLDRSIVEGLTADAQREGARGPVETVLRSFDPVQGFVTGSFNEASDELHDHLQIVATALATGWRRLGARSYAACRSAVVVDLYRRWGAAIANANANLRLTRLENLYTRGPTVRAWGARADADADVGGFADLGDLAPDTGGAHGPGFL